MTASQIGLTAEEKKKSYSKYYYQEPISPSSERLSVMNNPIDPSKALPLKDINDLLNPGYFEVEAGWCILPNGAGYVANLIKMPGVTVDMFNWWFAWHSLEDLRYKLWWPEGHFAISISVEDRKKILDPNRPITQKFQGLTHHVVEDIGTGKANINIQFLTPEEAGFDMNRFVAPNVGTLVAGNGRVRALNALPFMPWSPTVMCHFIREIPEGIELRTRFWMGYQIIEKKPKFKLPPFGIIKVPAAAAKGLAMHAVYEYTNLASILPQIYKEQKGVIA